MRAVRTIDHYKIRVFTKCYKLTYSKNNKKLLLYKDTCRIISKYI